MADPQPCADCPPLASTSSSSTSTPQPASSAAPAPPPPAHAQRASTHQQHDPLDPATFEPPALGEGHDREELPRVVIEFCDRCRVSTLQPLYELPGAYRSAVRELATPPSPPSPTANLAVHPHLPRADSRSRISGCTAPYGPRPSSSSPFRPASTRPPLPACAPSPSSLATRPRPAAASASGCARPRRGAPTRSARARRSGTGGSSCGTGRSRAAFLSSRTSCAPSHPPPLRARPAPACALLTHSRRTSTLSRTQKQRIRNIISPAQDLGHSDKPVKAKAPSTDAPAAAPAPPEPAPRTGHDSTSTSIDSEPAAAGARTAAREGPAAEERKPGQLLASDFAPTFRCG